MRTAPPTRFTLAALPEFLRSGALLSTADGRLSLAWGAAKTAAGPIDGMLAVFAPDFFLADREPWVNFPAHDELPAADLLGMLDGAMPEPPLEIAWCALERARFDRDFRDLQARIAAGELQKAVPIAIRPGRAHSRRVVPALLRTLLQSTRGVPVHLYGLWYPEEGASAESAGASAGILGATPELLLRERPPRDGRRVIETVALAGTRPHAASRRLPLLQDPKELREHRLVVDGIVASLRESLNDQDEVRVGETGELRLPMFSHLRTPIEVHAAVGATAGSPAFESLIGRLHPTPALGGYPRLAAWSWLKERARETTGAGPAAVDGRGRFGAPFGMRWSASMSTVVVAIRNLQWRGDEVILCAGCGVIAESELDREWGEAELKMESVRGLFS